MDSGLFDFDFLASATQGEVHGREKRYQVHGQLVKDGHF